MRWLPTWFAVIHEASLAIISACTLSSAAHERTRFPAKHEPAPASCLQKAGRLPQSLTLLAVSKTVPAQTVLQFALAGQQAFGENYLQEAVEKITHLADSPECPPLEWHFIGPLQSNKTRQIAQYFNWVHSVDRFKTAKRLSEQRPEGLAPLNVLVQVNTSGESSKAGVPPHEALALCQQISALPHLTLRGLMTIPSAMPTPASHLAHNATTNLEKEFLVCRTLFQQLQAQHIGRADTLSMGMSADLELAIQCGSTCVRVGSALFGARPAKPD
ncbi:MAG: YggS family pyridoxal phosphate-dependent enzyme [Limnobacter sp.]|nr:YggS family pyridoxal phosphate-dependent enzyme [Limnobacter sp.]